MKKTLIKTVLSFILAMLLAFDISAQCEGDFVFDGDYLAEWRRRFPRASVHTFPAAGHYLFEDEPHAAVAAIGQFLRAHPLTAHRRARRIGTS